MNGFKRITRVTLIYLFASMQFIVYASVFT